VVVLCWVCWLLCLAGVHGMDGLVSRSTPPLTYPNTPPHHHQPPQSYFQLTNEKVKFVFPEPGPLEGVKSLSKHILKMTGVTFQYPSRDKPTVMDICLGAFWVGGFCFVSWRVDWWVGWLVGWLVDWLVEE